MNDMHRKCIQMWNNVITPPSPPSLQLLKKALKEEKQKQKGKLKKKVILSIYVQRG